MNDETGFLAAVLKELATSTAVILAAWGALGGATNALTTRMLLRDALRHRTAGAIYCKKRTKLCPVRFQYSS